MSIQHSTPHYFHSSVELGFRQRVRRKRSLELPGGVQVWRSFLKVLAVTLPVVFMLNFVFSMLIHNHAEELAAMQSSFQVVAKNNGELQDKKESLVAIENVRVVAAEKLALSQPVSGQIIRMHM